MAAYPPVTAYSAATFQDILTRAQRKEVHQALRQLRVAQGKHPHKAFKKFIRLGMSMLHKAATHVKRRGFPLCEGSIGCNNCCRRVVLITSKLEVQAIEHWLSFADRGIRQALRDSMARMQLKKESCFLAMGVTKEPIPDMAIRAIGEAYPGCGGICPAVGPAGQCLIYPVRPWSCRTYRGLTTECTSGTRVNLARFPDIDMLMLNLLEKHAGPAKTTLFRVIRRSLDTNTQQSVSA